MTILEMSLLDLWLTIHNYMLNLFGYDGSLQYIKPTIKKITRKEIDTIETETNTVEERNCKIKEQAINGC